MTLPDDDEQEDEPTPDANAPTDSAADPEQHKRKRRGRKRELDEIRVWWHTALGTKLGRKIIWGLLRDAHTFEERFACGPNGFPQTEATWFHAGEQAWGLRFYQSLVLFDREAVFLMHDENDVRFKNG